MAGKLKDLLRGVAPVLAGAIGVPATAVGAATALARVFFPGRDPAEVKEEELEAAAAAASPEQWAEVKKADYAYKETLVQAGVDVEKIVADVWVKSIEATNQTIQVEGSSEHWPQWSWRPFIGFNLGFYIAAQWVLPLFGKTPVKLDSELILVIGAVLGVASMYRGRMQSDPNIQQPARLPMPSLFRRK